MIDDVAVATFGMHAWNETGSMFQQVVINLITTSGTP
jgi:hypothetical protein